MYSGETYLPNRSCDIECICFFRFISLGFNVWRWFYHVVYSACYLSFMLLFSKHGLLLDIESRIQLIWKKASFCQAIKYVTTYYRTKCLLSPGRKKGTGRKVTCKFNICTCLPASVTSNDHVTLDQTTWPRSAQQLCSPLWTLWAGITSLGTR